jgi:uncharacterized protein (TIGR03083 family)
LSVAGGKVLAMDFASVIEDQSAALAEAMRRPGALTGTVPACPDWSGADLVWHIGEVQYFWTAMVRSPGSTQPPYDEPSRPADGELLDWYDEVRTGLVEALRETPPGDLRWAWWAEEGESAYELGRRQGHEVLVHRWDAESVLGAPGPLEPAEVAADGVLEFCQRMLGESKEWSGPPGVLRLAATDTGDEWFLRLDPRPVLADAPGGEPLATVTAPAAALDLWLWRRTEEVTVEGDPAVAAAFHDWAGLN